VRWGVVRLAVVLPLLLLLLGNVTLLRLKKPSLLKVTQRGMVIRTFKVRIVNQYDGESCKGGPGNGTSTDTGIPVCYKMLQVLTL